MKLYKWTRYKRRYKKLILEKNVYCHVCRVALKRLRAICDAICKNCRKKQVKAYCKEYRKTHKNNYYVKKGRNYEADLKNVKNLGIYAIKTNYKHK